MEKAAYYLSTTIFKSYNTQKRILLDATPETLVLLVKFKGAKVSAYAYQQIITRLFWSVGMDEKTINVFAHLSYHRIHPGYVPMYGRVN